MDGQARDRLDDQHYYRGRADEAAVWLAGHRSALGDYVDFCEAQGFGVDEAALAASEQLCEQMDGLLRQLRQGLEAMPEGPAYYLHIDSLARQYRVLVQLRVAAVQVMRWGSAAYVQSGTVLHFRPEEYGGLGSRLNHLRFGGSEVERWRRQMKQVLGVGVETGLVAAASGMAGFSLLWASMLRKATPLGLDVYLPRPVYGEADAMVRECGLCRVVDDNLSDAEGIAQRIGELAPDIVLLEGMMNAMGNRLIDLPLLVDLLNGMTLPKPVCLLVDDTLLTASASLMERVSNPQLRMYVYGSASKYLQLGLDSELAGWVAVPLDEEKSMQFLAGTMGLGLAAQGALAYPMFDREVLMERQARLMRNAQVMAEMLTERLARMGIDVFYPGLEAHPDHATALKLGVAGTAVSLNMPTGEHGTDAARRRAGLMACVEAVVKAARGRGLQLAASEGFGFGTPRLTVTWCRRTPPYVRLAAGDRSLEETVAIANLIADELLRQIG